MFVMVKESHTKDIFGCINLIIQTKLTIKYINKNIFYCHDFKGNSNQRISIKHRFQ